MAVIEQVAGLNLVDLSNHHSFCYFLLLWMCLDVGWGGCLGVGGL